MSMKEIFLWIVMSASLYGASYILHKKFLEQNIFSQVYARYKGKLEKKIKEENWFVSKFGVIENRSIIYKLDRLLSMSGLKKRIPHLSAETFIIFMILTLILIFGISIKLSGNIFLSIFIGLLSVTLEFIIVKIFSGRAYNSIEDDTPLFVSILSNHAKSSSDIVTIMTRTLSSTDGPLRDLISNFLLNAEKTGNIDLAFDVMKESVDNRTLQTILINLKNCMHYTADYEDVLSQMSGHVSEAMSARQERKNIYFSMRMTVLTISLMSIIIVVLIGKGIGVDVKGILTENFAGQVILFITGLLYLFVASKLFGVDK